jgi:DNA-binding XRE family transcriptional regulator
MHEHEFWKLRKRMGLTQAQMAGLIRVPLVTVKKLEGRSPDRFQRARKLAVPTGTQR